MSENIKTRKYYRVHNGTDWDRMHFVTDANSVDANDGDNMETKVGAIKGITTSTEVTEEGYAADATTVAALNSSLTNMQQSFQDGCNTIYNAIVAKGVTPKSKSPADIATAIASITTDVKHTVSVGITGISETRAQLIIYVDGVAKSTGKHGNFYGTSMLDRIPAAITV